MNEPSPYQRLGVTEAATFEEIQEAKKRLTQQYQDNAQMLESVETAYDAVIMDRLRRRQEGRIKVPDRIRFPEQITEYKQSAIAQASKGSPSWLRNLLDKPSTGDILIPGTIYVILSILTVVASSGKGDSLLGLLMAIASFVAVYFIYRKEKRFGRALLLSLGGLVVGVSIGYALFSGLQGSNIKLTLESEQIAAIAAYIILWLMTSFLR